MSEKTLKCLPIGALPYENCEFATKMMVKLFEEVPYLAVLPKISSNDNITHMTLDGIPGVKLKDEKVYFRDNSENFKSELINLDTAFNKPTKENLDKYKIDSAFFTKYLQILKKLKPKQTVLNLLGPLTVSQILVNKDNLQILTNKTYRKLVIQAICVKAMWAISEIKKVSPDTIPVIVLEEPLLHRCGDLKRKNEEITNDVIVNVLSKVIQKIKDYNCITAVQSFEKCDWQIPIDAGVDIISFDAYNNPNNLNIIPDKINHFLANGGKINWGIVPVISESIVKGLTIDKVYQRFINTIESLVASGTNAKLTYNNSLVSIQGNAEHLPLIFAEKALILTTKLAKKIPIKN